MDQEVVRSFLGSIIFDMPPSHLLDKAFELVPIHIFKGEDRIIWEALKSLHKEGKNFYKTNLRKKIRDLVNNKYLGYDEIAIMKYINRLPQKVSGGQAIYTLLPELVNEAKKDILVNSLDKVEIIEPDEVLEDINESFINLNQVINLKKKSFDLESGVDEYISMVQKGFEGIKSYIKGIDASLGTFPFSEITILAGRPGTGKTTLAAYIFYKALLEGYKSCYLSFEMPSEKIVEKMIDAYRFESGLLDKDLISSALDFKKKIKTESKIYDDDIYPFSNTVKKIVTHAEEGYKFFVIDHIQLISTNSELSLNRVQELSYISSTLKSLANRYNLCFLVLSQLSRLIERRSDNIPKSSDLRDSGSLEQDAANIIFIVPREYEMDIERKGSSTHSSVIPIPPYRETKLYITKARYGAKRRIISDVIFIPSMNIFANVKKFKNVRELPRCKNCGSMALSPYDNGVYCEECGISYDYRNEIVSTQKDGYTYAGIDKESVAIKTSVFVISSLLKEQEVLLPWI